MRQFLFPTIIVRFFVLMNVVLALVAGCSSVTEPQPPAVPTQTVVIPTMFIPTPDCGTPTLVLGTSTFQIQNLPPAADGSVSAPLDTSGVAYWVAGTDPHFVFILSPTPENLAVLPTVTAGGTAKVTWSNCNSTTYTLSASQPGSIGDAALSDQSVEGISVFFQTDPAGAAFVLNGELTEEQISTFSTPEAGASDIQAEISLLETTASPDGATIRVGVSIQNYGAAAFTVSTNEVSLTQGDGTPLALASSEPPLPKEIAPGSKETIFLTFPRPSTPTATLKIFTVEYDI